MKQKAFVSIYSLFVLGLLLLIISSCKKNNEDVDMVNLPSVTTSEVTSIKQYAAECGGNITSDGGYLILQRGVCWSSKGNPTINDSITKDGNVAGAYTSKVLRLKAGTKYYLRAYASNSQGVSYGNTMVFKTISDTVTDIDGNVYKTVLIGDQLWMAENMKATHLANGAEISLVSSASDWNALIFTSIAYCNYNDSIKYRKIYGALYTWDAAQNVCPAGWHLSTANDWSVLLANLKNNKTSGGELKEADTLHWASPNTNATNSSGFTALPGGCRNSSGTFTDIRKYGYWWTDAKAAPPIGVFGCLYYNSNLIDLVANETKFGRSVRCVKN